MKSNSKSRYYIFYLGVAGIALFVTTCFLGGFLIEGYSISKQFISETYAIDTEYGLKLRIFGHIPSGILFFLFYTLAYKYYPNRKFTKIGFYGLAIFYGLGTVLVSIFPCDSRCNKDWINPSIAQIIHNVSALLIYILGPLFIWLCGYGVKRLKSYSRFSKISYTISAVSIVFVFLLFSEVNSAYVGIFQRIVELTFILWLLVCALRLIRFKFLHSNKSEESLTNY